MINKALLYFSLVLLVTSITAGALLRLKTAENSALKQELEQREMLILSLKDELSKQEKACELADELTTEFEQERKKLSLHAKTIIEKVGNVSAQSNEASVTDKLPSDLVSLLKQASANEYEDGHDAR